MKENMIHFRMVSSLVFGFSIYEKDSKGFKDKIRVTFFRALTSAVAGSKKNLVSIPLEYKF